MRALTLKYGGECRACSAALSVGSQAVYERKVGVWCPGCAPTDPDTIRALRQESLDKRADRLRARADKRTAAAHAKVEGDRHLWRDWAFVTQPGHIPIRARAIARMEKAHELMAEAHDLRQRADWYQKARVKGDAEARHEREREDVRAWIKPGMRVVWLGTKPLEVLKVNRKTARLRGDFGDFAADLILLAPTDEDRAAAVQAIMAARAAREAS